MPLQVCFCESSNQSPFCIDNQPPFENATTFRSGGMDIPDGRCRSYNPVIFGFPFQKFPNLVPFYLTLCFN